MNKIKLNTAYGIMVHKPIEKMNDDELIFWMLFERDGMTAMRNANEDNRLDKEIQSAEERYESYLNAVKDRMRKGGKPNAR